MNQKIVLSLEKIFLSYKSRQALRGVDFKLYEGEVHGLIGEHRAGKSSLVNLIAGAAVPDSGIIRMGEKQFSFMTPRISMKEGIAIVYQSSTVIPDCNAVEYLFSGQPIKNSWGKLNHKEMYDRANSLFQELEYSINLDVALYKLSVAQQHMVEFARTLISNNHIIILDEIAQKLTPGEMKIVYSTMKILKERGVSFIYISHDLDEILRVSDQVTILNNGVRIGTEKTARLDKYKLFELSYSYSVEQENKDDLKQKTFLREVLESATQKISEGILVLEDQDTLFYFNPALKDLFPEIESNWLGRRIQDTLIPELLNFGDFSMPSNENSEDLRQLSLDDGRVIQVSHSYQPYLPGVKKGRTLIFEDITFQNVLDEYIVKSEKFASLAELAVGVAHEINNPLFIVKNYLKLVQLKGASDNSSTREKFQKMEKELDRISDIVTNLLSFSKIQKSHERFDLNNLIQDVIDLIHHKLIEKKIKFIMKLQKGGIPLYGNPNRLKQVFLNILINSIDAVLLEGQIKIRTIIKNKHIRIEIEDNGCGIDDAIKQRILNPFFSTKITKSNTGLGLTISNKIIEEFSGSLSYLSEPGKGTTFIVELPEKESPRSNSHY